MMPRAQAALFWLAVWASAAAHGVGSTDVSIEPVVVAPPVLATTASNGVEAAAAAPVILSNSVKDQLDKVVIKPLCGWMKRFKPGELCFAMSTKGASGSVAVVTSWTSLCTSLYAGMGVRAARSASLKWGDGVVAVGCEEAHKLARASACKATAATNPFAASATCPALLAAVVTQLNRLLATLPAASQAGVMRDLLKNVPPAPAQIVRTEDVGCRRAVRDMQVKANPCAASPEVIQKVKAQTELAYSGVALKSCGAVWAGVVVGGRLGFVNAKDLGYCSGEEACSVSGQYCAATGSPCCSAKCGRIYGTLTLKLGDKSYPFKTFDGNVEVEYTACIGPAPPAKKYGVDVFLFGTYASSAASKSCTQLKSSKYLVKLREWVAAKAGVPTTSVTLKACATTGGSASVGMRRRLYAGDPGIELSLTLMVAAPSKTVQTTVLDKLSTEFTKNKDTVKSTLSKLAVETDMGSFTVGGLAVEILNAPDPCVRPGLNKRCTPGASKGSAQRCCASGDTWHGKQYWDTKCEPLTAGGPNICSCPKSCTRTVGPFWCWCIDVQ